MFVLLVNGEEAATLDVDHRLVDSLEVGPYKIPVQFNQDIVDVVVNFKSELDAEYLAAVAKDNAPEVVEEETEEDDLSLEEEKPVEKKAAKKKSAKAK